MTEELCNVEVLIVVIPKEVIILEQLRPSLKLNVDLIEIIHTKGLKMNELHYYDEKQKQLHINMIEEWYNDEGFRSIEIANYKDKMYCIKNKMKILNKKVSLLITRL